MKPLFLALMVLGGCATTGLQTVPMADWQTVPAAERAKIDRAHEADVARTQGELRVAAAAVVEARRVVAAKHHAVAAPVAGDDEWADALRAHEHSKADALARIDTATLDWQRASLAWREQRVELLASQLDVLSCMRELERARAIDHHLLGDDTYDTAGFRGQLARVQERWFAAVTRTDAALAALSRASSNLSSSKELYAGLVRRGPTAPTSGDTTLRLTNWTASALHDRAHRWKASPAETHYLVQVAHR